MEYPGSTLFKIQRRLILLAFFLAFSIITPILILYSAGYRYDFQNGLLKETGIIDIDVEPANAIVYLNGIKISGGMPVKLTSLTPNKYNVRISAPNYFDWEKNVDVENKQTVYIKDIAMIKKDSPREIAEGKLNFLSLSPDYHYLIYQLNNADSSEIRLRDNNNASETTLLKSSEIKNISVNWAPQNSFFALNAEGKIYIFDAQNTDKTIDLSQKIKSPIKKVEWKETTDPELFFSTADELMSIIPTTENQYDLGKNSYMDWYIENGQLWSLQLNTTTNKLDIIKDTLGFNSLFTSIGINNFDISSTSSPWQLLYAHNDNLLLQQPDRSTMTITTKDKKYNLSGNKFLISPYNNWWLMWTPWELWTYNEGESPLLLNRSGEQLQQVAPLDKFNTLGLVWADKTTVLFPYYYVSHDLLNHPVDFIAANSDKRIVYFIAKINNKEGLWSLNY